MCVMCGDGANDCEVRSISWPALCIAESVEACVMCGFSPETVSLQKVRRGVCHTERQSRDCRLAESQKGCVSCRDSPETVSLQKVRRGVCHTERQSRDCRLAESQKGCVSCIETVQRL